MCVSAVLPHIVTCACTLRHPCWQTDINMGREVGLVQPDINVGAAADHTKENKVGRRLSAPQ